MEKELRTLEIEKKKNIRTKEESQLNSIWQIMEMWLLFSGTKFNLPRNSSLEFLLQFQYSLTLAVHFLFLTLFMQLLHWQIGLVDAEKLIPLFLRN